MLFLLLISGYAYSQGMTESVLGAMMALGAITGILGTFGFQFLRGKVGLVRTGLLSLVIEVSCLSLCVASVWAPGSPFDPFLLMQPQKPLTINCTNELSTTLYKLPSNSEGIWFLSNDHTDLLDFTPSNMKPSFKNSSDLTSLSSQKSEASVPDPSDGARFRTAGVVNYTCINTTSTDIPERNYVSLALLMTGIITARFGKTSSLYN
jgi:hypothetical protein